MLSSLYGYEDPLAQTHFAYMRVVKMHSWVTMLTDEWVNMHTSGTALVLVFSCTFKGILLEMECAHRAFTVNPCSSPLLGGSTMPYGGPLHLPFSSLLWHLMLHELISLLGRLRFRYWLQLVSVAVQIAKPVYVNDESPPFKHRRSGTP